VEVSEFFGEFLGEFRAEDGVVGDVLAVEDECGVGEGFFGAVDGDEPAFQAEAGGGGGAVEEGGAGDGHSSVRSEVSMLQPCPPHQKQRSRR